MLSPSEGLKKNQTTHNPREIGREELPHSGMR